MKCNTKKKAIIYIALMCVCIAPAFSQEHIYIQHNNNERAMQFSQQTYPNGRWKPWTTFCFDYDNPANNYLVVTDTTLARLYRVDDNLNILDTIVLSDVGFWCNDANFKFNDKLYSITAYYNPNIDYYSSYLDSICLFLNDINGNNMLNKTIYVVDSTDENKHYRLNHSSSFVSKEDNIVINCYGYVYDENHILEDILYNRLIVIDTLGNVLNNKEFAFVIGTGSSILTRYWAVCRNFTDEDNYFGLNTSYAVGDPFNEDEIEKITKTYYLDKQTLDIVDSALYDGYITWENITKINDSIAISITRRPFGITPIEEYFDHYIISIFDYKNHHLIDTIVDSYDGMVNLDAGLHMQFQKLVDFTSQDSIYLCYFNQQESGLYGSFNGLMHIVNFGINGIINYEYDLEYNANSWYQLEGIKATQDGGVIIALIMDTNSAYVKFNPNGVVSINGAIGEKPLVVSYPNPTNDNINFSCSEVIKEIEIFNLLGQQVYAAKVNDKFTTIDVGNFAKGNYVAKLHTDKGVTTKKFVVE